MELTEELKKLKSDFSSARDTEMTDEEFSILLISLPAFLVGKADGHFDESEKDVVIEFLYNFLYQVYGDELTEENYEGMISNYLDDFNYLNQNQEWKDKLLSGLKTLNSLNEELQEVIENLMEEVSAASGVNTKEKELIDKVKEDVLN